MGESQRRFGGAVLVEEKQWPHSFPARPMKNSQLGQRSQPRGHNLNRVRQPVVRMTSRWLL